MQKILSRALEARSSCRCAFCTPFQPGIVRTVNTLPVRQRLKFGDVVTIVYGTVLGTAAFYNGTSKKRRREALDNAIEGVLSKNEELQHDQEARLQALGYKGSEAVPLGWIESTIDSQQKRSSSLTRVDRRPSVPLPGRKNARQYSQQGNWKGFLIEEAVTENTLNGDPLCEEHTLHDDAVWKNSLKTFPDDIYNLIPGYRSPQERQRRREAQRLDIGYWWHSGAKPLSTEYVTPILPQERQMGKSIEKTWAMVSTAPEPIIAEIRRLAIARLVLRLARAYLRTTDVDASADARRIQFKTPDGMILNLGLDDYTVMESRYENLGKRMDELDKIRELEPQDRPELQTNNGFPCFEEYDASQQDQNISYHSAVSTQLERLEKIVLQSSGLAQLASDVCTFLLSCKVCPDIHTLNFLMISFLDFGWYEGAMQLSSTLRENHETHNQVTRLAYLELFHQTQSDKFLDSTRALMEKFHWTSDLFSVIIVDLLDRQDLTQASREITSMRLSGFTETPEVLQALLVYSCENKDWEVALKTWARYDTLELKPSVIAWYWMLQICARFDEHEYFQKILDAGLEQEVFDSRVGYEFSNFQEHDRIIRKHLRRRMQGLRRLEKRIFIPDMAQRQLQVGDQDIIQMENLSGTLIMAHLQYAKLRCAAVGWFYDHLGRTRKVEHELEQFLFQHHKEAASLSRVSDLWSAWDTKCEAIAAICHGSYQSDLYGLQEAITRIATSPIERVMADEHIDEVRKIFREQPPASQDFYTMLERQREIFQRCASLPATGGYNKIEHISKSKDTELPPVQVEWSDKDFETITKQEHGRAKNEEHIAQKQDTGILPKSMLEDLSPMEKARTGTKIPLNTTGRLHWRNAAAHNLMEQLKRSRGQYNPEGVAIGADGTLLPFQDVWTSLKKSARQ